MVLEIAGVLTSIHVSTRFQSEQENQFNDRLGLRDWEIKQDLAVSSCFLVSICFVAKLLIQIIKPLS